MLKAQSSPPRNDSGCTEAIIGGFRGASGTVQEGGMRGDAFRHAKTGTLNAEYGNGMKVWVVSGRVPGHAGDGALHRGGPA